MRTFYLFLVAIVINSILFVPAAKSCKNGLIAYWSFDDSTAKDQSGNGYHGTIVHTPKPVVGVNGKGLAFKFTGRGNFSEPETSTPEGDHILLPKIPFENYKEFSITMWVFDEEYSYYAGEGYIYFGDHLTGWLGILNHKEFAIEDTVLYTHYAVGGNDNNPPLSIVYDKQLKSNWIFFALVYENGTIKAYRNGKFIGEKKQTVNVKGYAGALGRHWWGNRTSARFSGKIDEVKIYCKALQKEEIEKEYVTCENADLDQLEIGECPKPSTKATINFPPAKTNEEVISILHLKNRTDHLIVINQLNFIKKNFYFASNTFPLEIQSQGTTELEIRLKQPTPGIYSDELIINDICSEYLITINAEVKDNPCKNGLIAYWSFDDSTARDNSGNGYDGTIMNKVEPVKGYNGKNAFRFYGVGVNTDQGGHILLPQIPFNEFQEFSICFWAWNEEPSFYHGESYIAFGDQSNGFLGINNHKLIETDNSTLYDHFAVGANPSIKPLIINYDYNLRRRWVYYAMTYDGITLKAYRDGKYLGEKKQTISINQPQLAAIARHWWTDEFGSLATSSRFNGILDDMKIYCRALTKEEIEEGYISCDNKDLDKLEILECPKPQNNSAITFPTVKIGEEVSRSLNIKNKTSNPLTIISLNIKNNNFYFASGTFPLALAPNSTVELKIFFRKNVAGVYQDELKIYDVCTEYTFSLHGEATDLPCRNGLIAYWSFDDSTARDFSGNGFHGSIHNSPKFINGYKGACIELHGEGSYTTGEPRGSYVGLPSIPFEEYEEFTVSLFAKEESFSYYAGEAMIWFGYLNSAWLGMMTTNHAGNDQGGDLYSHFAISANSSAQNDFKAFFDPTVYRNNWINYTMTYSNGNVKCYRNGVFLGSFYQKTIKLEPYGAIGRHWWTADGETRSSTRYNGLIDEVKIYCRALTEEEIKKEYDPCALGLGNEFEIVDMPKTDSILTVKFDSVGVGKQCVRTIKIKNITEVPVILNSIYVAENIHFSIPQSQFPIQFAPQEIKEIEVYLIPKLYGKLRDTLIWDDKCNPWRIALDADSYGTPDTLNGICGTVFEARIDSIKTKYFMSLRSPRYSSSNSLVTVDFETNFEGTPMYRDIDLFNSLGDLVAQVHARVTYAENKIVNGVKIRRGSLSFSKGALPSGLYFIKSENGVVGIVMGE